MRKLLTLLLVCCSLSLAAQEKQEITQQDYANQQIEMADELRANGKIYVVVGVITIILAGLLIYAITIDRKVSRLEKLAEENPAKMVHP